MTENEFVNCRNLLNSVCCDVLKAKGQDYTGASQDRLANFKRIAETLNLTPLQVWAVYFHKHIDAIMSYATQGRVESEPIAGRFVDARNYLDLGYALICEVRQSTPAEGDSK